MINTHQHKDKQYWVLCAVYRMTRQRGWPKSVVTFLLQKRAKYSERDAIQITSIWFKHGHPTDN